MTSPWYNPTFVTRNTRALAESINNELTKIKAAFDQLPPPGSVGSGTQAVYTHFAYADSADGTANFTTGSPGARSYVGIQPNSANPTPSEFPVDYQWSRIGAPSQDDLTLELNAVQAQAAQALADAATAITNAATAQATADGKVTSFFQNSAPTAEGVGDLWIDTDNGNRLYRWNGSAWVEIQDQAISDAITAAATAQATADGKIVSFYQNDPPTAGAVGDFWIDTNDSNKLYRWSGSAWVAARDAGIVAAQAAAAQALLDAATAISNAATAQATADGKVTTFFQNEPPLAEGVGDLWIDTNDGNKLYRWNGAVWSLVRDAGIGAAITAASTAQATADGKIVTFYQASAPTAVAVGDLWIDTDDSNKLYRWSGSAWVAARDAGIALAQAQAADANAAAAAAQSAADTANTAISNITADGILSRDEKPEIRKQRDAIISERPIIRARAVALGVSVTNYDADYTALIAYLGGLDLGSATDTPITRTTFNTFFTDYYAERQIVLDSIADEASKRATVAGAEPGLVNANVPLGNANRVPLSRMEGDSGWLIQTNPSGLAITQQFAAFEGMRFYKLAITATASNQVVSIGSFPSGGVNFRVTGGERLSVQSRVEFVGAGAAGGTWNLTLWVILANGSQVSGGSVSGSDLRSIGAGFVSFFATMPANAVGARLELYGFSGGAGNFDLVISEPMVTSAAADQAVHPPYSPGPVVVEPINAGGPLLVGTLPPSKADPGLINANVPLGSNAIVNSDFTRGKFGWRWRGGGFENDWGVNLTGSPNWFGQRNVMWATVPGVYASGANSDLSPDALWAGAPSANAPLFAMPVVSGDRLFASVLAARHRCTFQLWILQFDAAFNLVGADEAIGGTPGGAANGDPANFTRVTRFSVATSTARWAIPMMRMIGTGENDPFIFFTEPMLSKVPANQTAIPPYTPGRADPNADVTAQQQRTILAQFPSIEIKQGEAGNVGNRTVTHRAFRAAGTVEITGGTWSVVDEDLGTGDASVNASTGTVTLSGIVQSGKYVLLHVDPEGISTLAEFNVTYVPTPPSAIVSARTGVATSANGTADNNNWQTIVSLNLLNVPTGRVNFGFGLGVSFITPATGIGTADMEARLLLDGTTTLASVLSQNVVTGGVITAADFSGLFQGAYLVSAGNRTFEVQFRRTLGSGRLLSTTSVLEATVIAT